MPIFPLDTFIAFVRSSSLVGAFTNVRQTVGRSAPDPQRTLREYDAMAHAYEQRTAIGDQGRRDLVARLAPRRGDVILDVGCGTGRNFAPIVERIGPEGRLIGIDPSPQMIARARALVRRRGWTNVELVCSSAEDASIEVQADAALLCAVHDVMRSPVALANVLAHLRDGGRIVAGGPKWVPWRRRGARSLNLATLRFNRGCVSTFEGFTRPWDRLAALVEDLRVDERYLGCGYIATGVKRITPSVDATGSAARHDAPRRG